MEGDSPNTARGLSSEEASQTSSELNNLLQVIASASSMLEGDAGPDTEKYRSMLRESVQRAEKLAAGLAAHAGGTPQRTLTRAEATSAKADRGKGQKPAKQLVLVVDDEEMGLTIMRHVLTAAGFEVATASSGFECLEQFRQRPNAFAMILLDLSMPFMDGEETFTRLKEIRADVPVILATGFIQQDRLDRMMSAGMAGFLRKPIAPDEIVALVRRTLAELRYASEPSSRGFSVM